MLVPFDALAHFVIEGLGRGEEEAALSKMLGQGQGEGTLAAACAAANQDDFLGGRVDGGLL